MFLTTEAPDGVVSIDPAWWTAMGMFTLVAGVLAVVFQVREYVRSARDEPS